MTQFEFYKTHAEPTMLALTRAQNRGILVDTALRSELAERYRNRAIDVQAKYPNVKLSSTQQLQRWLYGELKLDTRRSRKTGNPTLDEDALVALRAKYPAHTPIIDDILTFREADKLLTGFLSTEIDSDGRMRTSFNATGTREGRISSSKTPWGTGGNMQNIPRGDFRRMFVAGAGKLLAKADLVQAEAHATAAFCGDDALLAKFGPGFDIHRFNGSIIYRKPETEITKDQRQIAKRIVHGVNYLMGTNTLALHAKITVADAKRARAAYLAACPKLEPWWASVWEQVARTRKLVNPFGRERRFLDGWYTAQAKAEVWRSAVAFLPASTIADIIACAFIDADAGPSWLVPLLQVHDEIVFELPESRRDEATPIIRRMMERPITVNGRLVTIASDIGFGPNWFDISEAA